MRSALKIINTVNIIIAIAFFLTFVGLFLVSLFGKGPIVTDIWDIFRPTRMTELGRVPDFQAWSPIEMFRETINIGTQEKPFWVFESQEIWKKCDANVESLIIFLRFQFVFLAITTFLFGLGSFLCLKNMNTATRKSQFAGSIVCFFLSFNWILPIILLCCPRKTLINQHPYFE